MLLCDGKSSTKALNFELCFINIVFMTFKFGKIASNKTLWKKETEFYMLQFERNYMIGRIK